MSEINTWLLTYNPTKWNWDDYSEAVAMTKSGNGYVSGWNCSNHHAKVGDRVFLVKLGDNSTPKGIIATGYIVSDFWEGEHFDSSKDNKIMYVTVVFTTLVDYKTDSFITIDELNEKFPEQKWNPQASGISIKPDAAKWLVKNWNNYCKTESINNADVDEASQPVIWKISHGDIPKNVRSVLEQRAVVVVHQGTMKLAMQNKSQGEAYMKEIKKGDYFFLCYSGEIVLFGQFTENEPKLNYEMVHEWNDYDWYERPYKLIANSLIHDKYKGKKKIWTSNYNSTCVKVTDNPLFEKLILDPYFGLKISDLMKTEYRPPYTSTDLLNEVFMTDEEYNKLAGLMRNKKNVILQGAPGVGKTFTAKLLAYSIMGEKDPSRVAFVQFHQSYSYEDFIMGYRPTENGSFKLTNGVFYEFCKTAADDPDRDYFFIIDEINRGNLSKIFGELLMLIESDKRGPDHSIDLVYGAKDFYVPENLYIIGMMNTADRSLAMIDYALRRRFGFYSMKPAFENTGKNGFADYMAKVECELYKSAVAQVVSLNQTIRKELGEGFEIGHSYFSPENTSVINDDWVRNVIEFELLPLIDEYCFDDKEKGENWSAGLRGLLEK